ncbi:MAG: hypothetical protein R3194_01260 [Limnobacter sp.]|nr:hypothetical protein [Limnobacter sp.]
MPHTTTLEHSTVAKAFKSNQIDANITRAIVNGLQARVCCIASVLQQEAAQSPDASRAKEIKKCLKLLKTLSLEVRDNLIRPLGEAEKRVQEIAPMQSVVLNQEELKPVYSKLKENRAHLDRLRTDYHRLHDKATTVLNKALMPLPESRKTQIQEISDALNEFEGTIEFINCFGLQSWRCKLHVTDMLDKLNYGLDKLEDGLQADLVQEMIAEFETLRDDLKELMQRFENRQVQNLNILNLHNSAVTNHSNACSNLSKGKTETATLLGAIAKRHSLDQNIIADFHALSEIDQRIQFRYFETVELLEDIQVEIADSRAQQWSAQEIEQAPFTDDKARVTSAGKATKAKAVKAVKPTTPEQVDEDLKPSAFTQVSTHLSRQFIVQAHAHIDWVKQDLNALQETRQGGTLELASAVHDQLEQLRFKMDTMALDDNQVEQAQDQFKTELSAVEQAIEHIRAMTPEVSVHISEPDQPAQRTDSPPASPPTRASTPSKPVPAPATVVVPAPATLTSTPPITRLAKPAPHPLKLALSAAIDQFGNTASRLDKLCERQSDLKQRLLQNDQPQHPAWAHLTPAMYEIESLRVSLLTAEHLMNLTGGFTVTGTTSEILRYIQLERHNPDFDSQSAVFFVQGLAEWIKTFDPAIDRASHHTQIAANWLNKFRPVELASL